MHTCQLATAFVSVVAFKYGTRLLPLLKTSLDSLLAFLIPEEATILLDSPQESGKTTLSSSRILLKPYLKSAIFKISSGKKFEGCLKHHKTVKLFFSETYTVYGMPMAKTINQS